MKIIAERVRETERLWDAGKWREREKEWERERKNDLKSIYYLLKHKVFCHQERSSQIFG